MDFAIAAQTMADSFIPSETWAKVAGIGGAALGALVIIFRSVIYSKLLSVLTKRQSFFVLVLIIVLTWTTALAGIGAWVYIERDKAHSRLLKPSYVIADVTDEVDFSKWTAPSADRDSAVYRNCTMQIKKTDERQENFEHRLSTTGSRLDCEIVSRNEKGANATCNNVPPLVNRSAFERLIIVQPEEFQHTANAVLKYKAAYWNAWKTKADSWVSSRVRYPTEQYHFRLVFPASHPWLSVRVQLQKPGAAESEVVSQERNDNGRVTFDYVYKNLQPDTKLTLAFDWPPMAILDH
ncbi:MAG: hypothetical protein QOH71_1482 [Blastocatellia bacterium]|jgi:hypothetical protein|nr:hypothetical protein [Blastocatellia bacterium]